MEAVIVALFALTAIALIETVYCVAISLARWLPVLSAGIIGAWLASGIGFGPLDAAGVGLLASLIARWSMRLARAPPKLSR